jgi:hypothetical protein
MPRLVYSSEKHGQGATIELDSKEVVVCSIAQMGVLVYLYNNQGLIGSILSNFWGARLYNQRDVYKNAQTAQALSELYPDVAEPFRKFKNPALQAFTNAIWHCGSAAEVCTVLNEAASKLPELERTASERHIQRAFETAKNYKPQQRPPEMMPGTYHVVWSDGVKQQMRFVPAEIQQWVADSNKAEADKGKSHRVVRVVDLQGRVMWGK